MLGEVCYAADKNDKRESNTTYVKSIGVSEDIALQGSK